MTAYQGHKEFHGAAIGILALHHDTSYQKMSPVQFDALIFFGTMSIQNSNRLRLPAPRG